MTGITLNELAIKEKQAKDMLDQLVAMRETHALDGPTFNQVAKLIRDQEKALGLYKNFRHELEKSPKTIQSSTRSSFVIGVHGTVDSQSPIFLAIIEIQELPKTLPKFIVHIVNSVSSGRDLHRDVMPAINNTLGVISTKRNLNKVPLRLVFSGSRYTPVSLLKDLHPHFDNYEYLSIRGGRSITPQNDIIPSIRGGRPAMSRSASELYLIQSVQRGIELTKERFVFDLPEKQVTTDLMEQLQTFSKKSFREQDQPVHGDEEKDFSLAIALMAAWFGCHPWM